MGCSERQKELRRRRKRRVKLLKFRGQLAKATHSEKIEIARKLRSMTPGALGLIADWKLTKADR